MGDAGSKIEEHVNVVVQPIVNAIEEVLEPLRDTPVPQSGGPDPQMELERAKAEQERLKAAVQKLQEELDDRDPIETDQDLDQQIITSTAKLHELARKVTLRQLVGRHMGLLGNTSSGKSSMVNTLMGANVTSGSSAEVPVYDGLNYHLYDFPGQNDDVSYFTKDVISLMKGLTHRLVLCTATVKEMKRLVNLFEATDLHYDLVVNKFDLVDFEERAAFAEKIRAEVQTAGWEKVDHLWFISAKHPEQFPDWLQMVDHLTS